MWLSHSPLRKNRTQLYSIWRKVLVTVLSKKLNGIGEFLSPIKTTRFYYKFFWNNMKIQLVTLVKQTNYDNTDTIFVIPAATLKLDIPAFLRLVLYQNLIRSFKIHSISQSSSQSIWSDVIVKLYSLDLVNKFSAKKPLLNLTKVEVVSKSGIKKFRATNGNSTNDFRGFCWLVEA